MNFRQEQKSGFVIAKVDANYKGFSSFIDENSLLLNSPESIKDYDDLTYLGRKEVMKSPFAKSLSDLKTPFNDYLKGKNAVVETDNDFVVWRSYGDPELGHMFLEKVSSHTYLGLAKTDFEFKVTFDGHLPGSTIMPLYEKSIKIKVKSYGRASGGGFIYTGELITDDESVYLPDDYIKEGSFYITLPPSYGEGSKDLAELEFGKSVAYTEYKVPLQSGGWTYKVTDKAHNRYGTIIMGNAKSTDKGELEFFKNPAPKISGWLEMQGFAQIEWQKELQDFYGSSSTTLIDKSSNYSAPTSPGALEFLEKGNIFKYSPKYDGIDFITNKMKGIWYDKVSPSDQSVVFFGGKGFIEWFDEAVRYKYGNEAVLGTYEFVVAPAKSFHNDANVKGYAYSTYQFTQYNMQPWGKILVGEFPINDNTKVNIKKAPNGIYTSTSYEAMAFNIINSDTNIRKLIKRDSTFAGYVNGQWTPLGATGANNPLKPTSHERAYSWGYGQSWGLQIENVENTIWLKPTFA